MMFLLGSGSPKLSCYEAILALDLVYT